MKTYVPRKDPLQGLNLTGEDHGQPITQLRRAENLYLQNGKATKRRGFTRFNQFSINRTMLTQRRTVRRTHSKLNTAGVPGIPNNVLADRAYPPLGHGFIPWHTKYQPVHGSDFAWEFHHFTGQIDGSRNYFVWDHSNDEDDNTGGGHTVQWAGVKTAMGINISPAGKLVLTVSISDSATTWITNKVITSAATLSANTDYHIGINWTASTGTLALFINGVADNTLAFALGANDRWHGDPSRHFSFPNIFLLNRLYVMRELASDKDDQRPGGDPDGWYSEYPNTLECAAEGAGIYEIRLWNTTRSFTSGSYPRNRPLTAAEYGSGACLAYWPCDDGGGLVCANKVDARRVIQLLPAPPAYVPDTGFSSGLGLQFDQGCCVTQLWNNKAVLVDGLGRALARHFGRQAAGTSAAVSGIPALTVNLRIRTPLLPKKRPNNAGSPSPGGIEDTNQLMTVFMDNGNGVFGPPGNNVIWNMFIPWNVPGLTSGALYVSDSGYRASGAVLADDTVISIWVVRDRLGAVKVYLDNNTATYATANILGYAPTVGNGISVCIGGIDAFESFRGANKFTGRFRMEWCRVWGRELTEKERLSYYNRRLENSERGDASLYLNLEVASVTGSLLPSFCSYASGFELGQITGSDHLGTVGDALHVPNVEWWDSWPNAVPPYWSTIRNTSWDAPGQEGAVEGIRNHRSVVKGDTQMAVAAHGAFSLTSLFSAAASVLAPVVPERASSYRQWAGWAAGDHTRLIPAADRLFIFHDEADPHVWTGSTLSPIGIDLPVTRRFNWSPAVHPAISSTTSVVGFLTGLKFYSYKFVYVDEEFNVVAVIGPTFGAQPSPSGSLVIGANSEIPSDDDQRPIRAHLNPRVSGIRIYRSRGSDTRELAEAGPHLFLSHQENGDLSGIDTIADTNLGESLDDRFDRPPLARFGDLFNGRLVLGNFARGQDTILASEAGLPETFDLTTAIPTEDGTGGVITGIRTAFDACWVFKSQSIWRVVDTGAGVLGTVFTNSLGCVAPGSLIEFFNAALGRRMLFFWSATGPCLFDGNQPVEIKFPLQGDPAAAAFQSMNEAARSDIYAVDMELINQIWVFGKAFGSSEYTKLYAYDYQNNLWVEHTGLRFTAVARIDVPGNPLAGNVSGVPLFSYWFAGDHRGGLWVVDQTTADGSGFLADADRRLITTDISNTSTTTVITASVAHAAWTAAPTGIRSMVATLVRANGSVEYRWILSNDTLTITLEAPFNNAPTNADTLYIGGIQFLLEFPWDAMDAQGPDKYAHYLETWANAALFLRTAVDWAALSGAATLIPSSTRHRERTYINKLCEVVKLELSNLRPGEPVTLPGYAWEMSPTRSTVRAE